MYFDFKVKIPEVKGKIYERTIKGVVYINYEYDRVYDKERRFNIPRRGHARTREYVFGFHIIILTSVAVIIFRDLYGLVDFMF